MGMFVQVLEGMKDFFKDEFAMFTLSTFSKTS